MSEGDSAQRHSIRWHRLNAGMTIDELSLASRVSKPTILRLEQGGRARAMRDGDDAERRIADALGIKLARIAFGVTIEDEPEPVPDGRVLRDARIARGFTPTDVAYAARVPIRTVLRAEAGAAIHPRYAKALADVLGLRVSDFYPRERRAVA